MKKVLLMLAVLAATNATGQTSKDFREDFNDNKNKWFTGTNEFYAASISDGKYTIEYIRREKPEKNIFTAYGKTNLYKPFEIETRIRLLKASGVQNSFGISIGEKDRGNAYYYVVSPELKMSWWYHMSGYKNTVIETAPLLVSNFKNDDPLTGTRLLARMKDNTILFYVNDELIARISRPASWPGNGVGLFLNPGTTVAVDYFSIRQL